MEEKILKPTTVALQGLILIFSFCLIWFTFFYYPKVVKERSFALPFHPFKDKVVVNVEGFPVETPAYRITHEKDSGLFYVFVQGQTLDVYEENKDAAQLAIKNALSAESLCSQKIVYSSVDKLNLPDDYKVTSNCN